MRFIYCPLCGEKLSYRQLGDEVNVPWCDRCNRPFFDMFSSCVIVLVVNGEGKVALLKAADRVRAYRTLVSGYIQPGESAEECARREVQEEIGVVLHELRLIQTVWFPRGEQLMIAFIGYTKDQELRLSCEVEEAAWYEPEEAIHLVHPKGPGNASNLLVETWLKECQQKY
ncbi:MAG: NUDIX domain-containing protein [Clostridia bacterium]|nr:NUDIX domain-containing protein [Clostridia bacterium]